jgi:hypothetical protein
MENFNYKFIDWADLPIRPPAIPLPDVGCEAQGVSGGVSVAAQQLERLTHAPSLEGLE